MVFIVFKNKARLAFSGEVRSEQHLPYYLDKRWNLELTSKYNIFFKSEKAVNFCYAKFAQIGSNFQRKCSLQGP